MQLHAVLTHSTLPSQVFPQASACPERSHCGDLFTVKHSLTERPRRVCLDSLFAVVFQGMAACGALGTLLVYPAEIATFIWQVAAQKRVIRGAGALGGLLLLLWPGTDFLEGQRCVGCAVWAMARSPDLDQGHLWPPPIPGIEPATQMRPMLVTPFSSLAILRFVSQTLTWSAFPFKTCDDHLGLLCQAASFLLSCPLSSWREIPTFKVIFSPNSSCTQQLLSLRECMCPLGAVRMH